MRGTQKRIAASRLRRLRRVRRKTRGSSERVRLSVFRSSKQIYVQAIDDRAGVTLASSSSMGKELRGDLDGNKTDRARKVGEDIAKKLLDKGFNKAVFDRGWYKYHGRVKALAEGAREAGLEM